MTNAVSEMGSVVVGAFWKVLSLTMFLFAASMVMKYNYYQKTPIWLVGCVLFWLFSIVLWWLFSGALYTSPIRPMIIFWWYLMGGFRGHFIPHSMPAFPYFYTQPKINNVNYLITPQGCDKKDFPRIPEDKKEASNRIRRSIAYFFSPTGNTEDTDTFNSGNTAGSNTACVDKLIFGERAGHTNPCDRNYLGSYRLNDW
jgi:hypothetical protein